MSWLQQMRQHWSDPKPALVVGDQIVTYAELAQRIRRAAGWLHAQGLGPGDVVALQMPRSLLFLELHLGALATGVITLPLNPAYPASELDFYLEDSGAALAVLPPSDGRGTVASSRVVPADAALRQAVDETAPLALPAELPPETVAMILYTSGTTGRPKGAVLTHSNLRATVEALHHAWAWRADDVLIHALPLFHVHGLFVAQHGALRAGATTHWMDRFDAAGALDLIDEVGGTLFMGVPTFYSRLLALPSSARWRLDRVRLFTSGSAPLPARDHERFSTRFGHTILERYGMTEVGIVLTNPYDGDRRPGTVGFAVPGAQIRIVDQATGAPCPPGEVGEIQIRGPSVFREYLGRPDATAQALVDGWMRSGDLARRDPDGYVQIVGRSKDMILSGGLNVYPSEVEAVLRQHPAIAAAAVVGVPDPDLGERVVASVVATAEATVEPSHIIAWARQRLAPYKCPKAIERTTELPRNAMGKVQKAILRARWAQLRCRRATAQDAQQIAAWNIEMARETESLDLDPETVGAGVRAVFETDVGAWYLLAEVAGQVVGQCMITVEWSDWRNRPVWWFQSVYVPPMWRRRGVFRAMHKAVTHQARAAGAGGIRLYVDRTNHRAAKTYADLGMDDQHYALFETLFDG